MYYSYSIENMARYHGISIPFLLAVSWYRCVVLNAVVREWYVASGMSRFLSTHRSKLY